MTLEDRLTALEQIEAIKALKHRYFRACDAKDPETFRACFIAHGADIDYGPLGGFSGPDQAEKLATVFRRIALHTVDGKPVILDMHHGMHPDITLTGPGTATGRWTLKFRQLNMIERTERLLTGDYDDDYVIEDGRWKMARSHFRQLWAITRPLGDATVEVGQ
ncbi:nuclear transport factor 2 family protein [[Mycobacterium] kokjensenii]|uniref:Nuclear transport factor 2 family protein n=1 Tax=[Mycobacterium] kokjensenii TaxID=3064287 RepID=A0ABM9L7I7_9MYCO|nr:nuclear transport factor 2 family protein [Mycolicibacter sp. MU0083]CAJ1493972.1 nuclear transport factor 2 family protein [Mycolicibacter sp. MU0083]